MRTRQVGTRKQRAKGAIAAAALVAGIAGVLVLPGTASASTARCSGELTRAEEIPGFPDEENGLQYEFFCNEDIKAYSVTSEKELVYFTPEVGGTAPDGNATADMFSCEGPIPGHGFGCRALGSTNSAGFNNRFTGQLVTTEPPCPEFKGQEPTNMWYSVTTQQSTVTGSTFITSSQPFKFKNKLECPKPKPKPARRKGGRRDGKGGRN